MSVCARDVCVLCCAALSRKRRSGRGRDDCLVEGGGEGGGKEDGEDERFGKGGGAGDGEKEG